jgi:hypothetical protein
MSMSFQKSLSAMFTVEAYSIAMDAAALASSPAHDEQADGVDESIRDAVALTDDRRERRDHQRGHERQDEQFRKARRGPHAKQAPARHRQRQREECRASGALSA